MRIKRICLYFIIAGCIINLHIDIMFREKDEVAGTTMYDKSSVRVAKTDFLKMRSLSLNYLIPRKFVSKWHITDCAIGLQATNLFTWADKRWEGSDPEAAFATTPLTRTYTLNLNITF